MILGALQLVLLILVVGVIMWAINAYAVEFIWPPLLRLANAVAIIACVIVCLLWLLGVLGVPLGELWTVPRTR